ncbi:hypothetical protein [Prolixibacter sp. NT017]|uniref:hypothetical protein n=1 Tax=Prolixibacter sp. NT017 TaxID=2652390 RepID=UPI0012991749|nr:hypothetical protein [Prolixibacter sp. NT017]
MNRNGADMIAGRANYPATDAMAASGDAKSVGGKEINTVSRANYPAGKENYPVRSANYLASKENNSGPRATNTRLEEINSGRR